MTLAAELFTAIFPIMIIVAVWVGSDRLDQLAASVGMPDETRAVLQDALAGTGAGAFGVVGVLVVLVSSTSLSRALTRAYSAIWELGRPHTGLRDVWRWVGAVLLIAGTLILARLVKVTNDWWPDGTWNFTLALLVTAAAAVLVPWLLLSRAVPARMLLPGAVIFALAMSAVRPVNRSVIDKALQDSADQFGSLGVAFTYIGFLYALSFLILATALLGQVIATDEGRLGLWFRNGVVDPAGSIGSPDPETSDAPSDHG